MCEHENREAAMVVLEPGVWCDPCIAPIVKALNDGGVRTVASCCGHYNNPSRINLEDDREIRILEPEWVDAFAEFVHERVGHMWPEDAERERVKEAEDRARIRREALAEVEQAIRAMSWTEAARDDVLALLANLRDGGDDRG